ncbi:MAG: SOS response-associated peptidase, partial [Hyphomicrobiaceae bacterium]
MCNLYSMTRAREAVLRLFRVSDNRAMAFEPKYAIFPGHHAPIVRESEGGTREIVTMSWGFVLLQHGRAPRRVTNFRDDKTLKSPFWRDSFEQRRCLVPVSSFAEPKEVTPATWHWFTLAGDEPRPLFAFGGIWRRWKGPLKKDGPAVEIEVFSFMTTTPNTLVGSINHERMPVLLSGEAAFETWLKGASKEALALARPYPPERMRMV